MAASENGDDPEDPVFENLTPGGIVLLSRRSGFLDFGQELFSSGLYHQPNVLALGDVHLLGVTFPLAFLVLRDVGLHHRPLDVLSVGGHVSGVDRIAHQTIPDPSIRSLIETFGPRDYPELAHKRVI